MPLLSPPSALLRLPPARLRRQGGASMLEVLISLVLVSGALLGVAGIQVNAIKYSQGSQFRTMAVVLAADISERMQANGVAGVAGQYVVGAGVATAAGTDCAAAGCTSDQLAAYDLNRWQAAITAQLPGGSWQITQSLVGNPSTYTVVVSWVDRRTKSTYATAGTSETFTYTATKTVFN